MLIRNSQVFILVFDVTDDHYLENLDPFVDIAYTTYDEERVVSIFCGNKIDLADPSYDRSSVIDSLNERFGDRMRNMRVLFTSALTGEGISDIIPSIFDDSANLFCGCNDNTNKLWTVWYLEL